MRYHAEYVCADAVHRDDPLACPDKVIDRWSDGTHVILIHDGEGGSASSGIAIRHCPWCGKALSGSGGGRRIDPAQLSPN
jgi:hypothetical protein